MRNDNADGERQTFGLCEPRLGIFFAPLGTDIGAYDESACSARYLAFNLIVEN